MSEYKILEACEMLRRETKELYLSDHVAVIEDNISPLKFYRDYVAKNIPLLIKNGVKHWKAHGTWSSEYFRRVIPDKEVSVAVTPNGYADDIAPDESGRDCFIQPEERTMKFSDFLDTLDDPIPEDIFYIQQQNSNFETDYSELWRDVDQDLSWATEAFGKNPDAINFWMGDERAVTSMHKDPYENIYCVVSGEKDFILHPPTDLPWVPYGKYPNARYKKISDQWTIIPSNSSKSELLPETGNSDLTPWIAVDPLCPDYEKFPQYRKAHTLRVKVQAGDVLYLPSLWFHYVRQSHGCIAINYWYDMEYDIKYAYYLALEALCQ